MKKIGLGVALVLMGFLFSLLTKSAAAAGETEGTRLARSANLALRRTAHILLRQQGDSTSRIAPVQQIDDHTFAIRLEKAFAYDKIPTLLQESLEMHHIGTLYDVAVLDCTHGEMQLGYSFYDLKSPEGVACIGRVQEEGCHTLQVTFNSSVAAASTPSNLWWSGALGFLLAGCVGLVWYQIGRVNVPLKTSEPTLGQENNLLYLGKTTFDPANQTLRVADYHHTLTYREAKLLRLFAEHPNQLLERSFILSSVWGDEGIIVGRSADVFVSRLRKLLQSDPTLRITSIHGVGYRLEVPLTTLG